MTKPHSENSEPPNPKPTKLDQILTATRGRHGATIGELIGTTGWQPHTVRAALTRLRQRGHAIERTRAKSGGSRYRLKKSR